jgi:hypothetical protein
MTDTIYYLSCDIRVKNYKIVAERGANLKYHDIRSITVEELEYMHSLSGSYREPILAKKRSCINRWI